MNNARVRIGHNSNHHNCVRKIIPIRDFLPVPLLADFNHVLRRAFLAKNSAWAVPLILLQDKVVGACELFQTHVNLFEVFDMIVEQLLLILEGSLFF